MVNTDNYFVVVEDLNHAFNLLDAEKLLSHPQDVTGSVHHIFKSGKKFGNML